MQFGEPDVSEEPPASSGSKSEPRKKLAEACGRVYCSILKMKAICPSELHGAETQKAILFNEVRSCAERGRPVVVSVPSIS
jgi:hypothetical protein